MQGPGIRRGVRGADHAQSGVSFSLHVGTGCFLCNERAVGRIHDDDDTVVREVRLKWYATVPLASCCRPRLL